MWLLNALTPKSPWCLHVNRPGFNWTPSYELKKRLLMFTTLLNILIVLVVMLLLQFATEELTDAILDGIFGGEEVIEENPYAEMVWDLFYYMPLFVFAFYLFWQLIGLFGAFYDHLFLSILYLVTLVIAIGIDIFLFADYFFGLYWILHGILSLLYIYDLFCLHFPRTNEPRPGMRVNRVLLVRTASGNWRDMFGSEDYQTFGEGGAEGDTRGVEESVF